MGRKITENSNPRFGRSIFLSLEHNIRYIFPEIFSHFLLFGQVNQRNYDVVDIYQSKLFEQKLFVEVLRIIESIIQGPKCDQACKYKSNHECYLESIKEWDIVFYIIELQLAFFIRLFFIQIDVDLLMKFPLFISLFHFLYISDNKSNCRYQKHN